MKRKILLLVVLSCVTAISFGQRRPRTVVQRIIQLTRPDTTGKMPFQEALSKLKNTYRFTGQSLDRSSIGQLAWAGVGNRQASGTNSLTPGPLQSLFPSQLYIVTNEGVFFYQPIGNSLEQVLEGDVRASLAATATIREPIASAGCVMVVTSSVLRSTSARRSGPATANRDAMLLEAGHIAQNIQLQAVCLDQGLGSVAISDFDARAAARVCGLPRNLEALYMICVGYLTEQDLNPEPAAGMAVSKKAAIIVPSVDFQDEEFFTTLNTLTAAQIQTVVASNQIGPIRGVNKNPFDVQVRADQIRASDFDAIIIIGGPGARAFINDQVVLNLVRDAFNQKKIIGATSLGTSVLANAGILRGVKVTGLLTEGVNISNTGAIFTGELVENDSRVITCVGPQGAVKFAREVADAILSM